ncbi:lipopolysaccharide biosynthesis protein [Sphingobacterium sp. JB170]|uniref:lipopolysaccharide biosynthesis protein n=1 Tax=Sphingobacterium sp. JB170 TaxID=1434842 RepID=UPI00097F5B07|nr:lipopolysaccharide biosynthesis protein [Sphingobacterium sp. JB170]SJN28656.1 Lipopolysaccharide biosynthesis protein WzxC [Sphingobacterium sp. JB170]
MSLKRKTLSGLVWTIADTFILRGLSFISTIILARWLGPAEFGLIGMISVFVAIGTTIMDSGMSASLIRKRDANSEDYSTVFFLNLGLSLVFYIIIFFLAPLISSFYNQPVLTGLIRVYGLSFIIAAFSAVQLAILNSRMEFKRIMKQNMPGTIVGVSVGISLGYLGNGVWSIVFMYLSTQCVQSIILWLRSDWKPSLDFSKRSAKFHFGFGYKLMLSGLLTTVYQNIYNIIIGKFYSARQLGFFERSKAFNDYPVNILTGVMTKVTYPLLSSIQGDTNRISLVYRKIMRLAFFITCPLMFCAAAIAHPLFQFALGDEWLSAVPYFQILCLSSIFYPIHAFNLNVFKVYGRSEMFLKLEVIKKSIITVGLFVGFQFGIMGLVWSSVICNYLALFINTYYSSEMINYNSKQQFYDMLPTFLSAGIMFFVTSFIINHIHGIASIYLVGVGGFVSLATYLSLNFIIKSTPLYYCLDLLKSKKLKI